MLIRPATPADLAAIRALEQQAATAAHWSERDYDALFSSDAPKRIGLLAEDDDQLCGFCIARCSADEWEIENVVVAQARRRSGIATELVRRVIFAVRPTGAAVLLEVRESNVAARQLYEKLGFVEAGRRAGYYREPPEDALLLRLSPKKSDVSA
jgi:ribosomal-protein-alanine N-acetyltransferase